MIYICILQVTNYLHSGGNGRIQAEEAGKLKLDRNENNNAKRIVEIKDIKYLCSVRQMSDETEW